MRLLSYLSRKTSSSCFIPEIDGLRFIAIITVVLFHLNTAFSKELGIGFSQALDAMGGAKTNFSLAWWWVRLDLGVKLFFAISGFVLALPFLRYQMGLSDKSVNLKSYFTRRLTRLEPPFVISLVGFYLVHTLFIDANYIQYLKHLAAGLIYGHVFIFGEANPINPVSWSLETEAQFYLLVPVLFYLRSLFGNGKQRMLAFVLLVLLSVFFKKQFIWDPYLNRSIFSYFMNFAMGIMSCWYYLKYPRWFKERKYVFDLFGLAAFFGMFYFYKPQHHYQNIIFFNLSILFTVFSAFKGRLLNHFYSRKWIYTIGGMCYSIYLLHYAFFHASVKLSRATWVDDWTYTTNLILQILPQLFLVLLVSSIFYILFERPFMQRERKK